MSIEVLRVTFYRSACDQTSGTGVQVEYSFSMLHNVHAKCTPDLMADGLTLQVAWYVLPAICEKYTGCVVPNFPL